MSPVSGTNQCLFDTACGPNETVPQCEPCAITCADRDNICPEICIFNSQCYCKNGYLKKGGVCVPESEC
nr:unnamed protein product [Callosobruchus chinensis]